MAQVEIGLDVTATISGTTGVARYALELLDRLPRRAGVEVRPFAIGRAVVAPPPGVRRLRVPLRTVHAAWRLGLPPGARLLAGARVDLVHALDMVPPTGRVPSVVTIHDVLPLLRPEEYGARYRRIAAQQADAVRRGARVLTTCESTADEIATVLRLPRDEVAVAPLGRREPHPDPLPPPADGPYLLAVGALTPRKGFDVLAEALGRLPPTTPPLLLAGPDGWAADVVRARIDALGLAPGRLQLLGAVSDRQLDGLYRGATAMCHPSRAEGFGMPCLEAMHLGVPVVAGDIPPVREVGGAAIRLVPTGDAGALADALGDLLADPLEQRRMAEAGRARAAAYSWDRTTDAVVDLYRSLLL